MSHLRLVNLMLTFEIYLFVVAFLGTVLRLRYYWQIIGLARSFRRNWPKLFEKIGASAKKYLRTRQTLVAIAMPLGLLVCHLILFHGLYRDTNITLDTLMQSAVVLPLGIFASIQIILDVQALATAERKFDVKALGERLTWVEGWLDSYWARISKTISNLPWVPEDVDIERQVEKTVDEQLRSFRTELRFTMLQVAFQNTVRLACGSLLWVIWILKQ